LVANLETLVSSSLVVSNGASQRPATPATSIWGPDMAMHEPIETRRRVVAGSNRSFGIVFSCFFDLVGLWPLVAQNPPRFWALGLSMFFLVGELFAPRLLSPLNRLWSWFGVALHRVVNPIVMFLIYQRAVVPVA
jgi:hypothetical protein